MYIPIHILVLYVSLSSYLPTDEEHAKLKEQFGSLVKHSSGSVGKTFSYKVAATFANFHVLKTVLEKKSRIALLPKPMATACFGLHLPLEVDEELEWGDFGGERSEVEQTWYEWLKNDKEKIAKWFQLLGWNRAVILNELKELSAERGAHLDPNHERHRPVDSATPLHDFFVVSPI